MLAARQKTSRKAHPTPDPQPNKKLKSDSESDNDCEDLDKKLKKAIDKNRLLSKKLKLQQQKEEEHKKALQEQTAKLEKLSEFKEVSTFAADAPLQLHNVFGSVTRLFKKFAAGSPENAFALEKVGEAIEYHIENVLPLQMERARLKQQIQLVEPLLKLIPPAAIDIFKTVMKYFDSTPNDLQLDKLYNYITQLTKYYLEEMSTELSETTDASSTSLENVAVPESVARGINEMLSTMPASQRKVHDALNNLTLHFPLHSEEREIVVLHIKKFIQNEIAPSSPESSALSLSSGSSYASGWSPLFSPVPTIDPASDGGATTAVHANKKACHSG